MRPSLLRLLAVLLLLSWPAPPLFAADDEKDKEKEKEEEQEKEAEEADAKAFRIFTSARGNKTLKLKILARIDDETYKVEDPDGKTFNIKTTALSKSDQRFLDFWEPNTIFDLKSAKLNDVLDQMGYSALDLTAIESSYLVTATIDGKEGKFLLDPSRGWSTLDTAAAEAIGISLGQGRVNFNGTRSKQGAAKEFKAGLVKLESFEFQVIDLAVAYQGVPKGTLGAIGGDLLKDLNALVDYDGKRLFVKKSK